MRLERLLYFAVEVLLGIFLVGSANAQTTSTAKMTAAAISGTLTDPSGAAVVGASVTAQPLDAVGASSATKSGGEGQFKLVLAPGRYRVDVEHPSFQRAEREFMVGENEAQTWDVRLQLERMSATVTVTATAQPIPVESSASPVTVITHEDIEDRQEIWLADMLQSGGGINIAREGPFGGITTLFLDGGNSQFTKVLIDGAPANQPGGDIDYEGIDLNNVDKIEIVHGASSALYGSDALDGVIQIFTHRGTTKTPVFQIQGEGGTFHTGDGGAQLSGLLGAFDYSGSATYFSTQGQGPNDYFRNTALSGAFGWKFSNTNQLRLSLRNDSNDGGEPGQTLLGILNPTNHFDQHDFFASLAWDFSTGDHWQHRLMATDSYLRQSIDDLDSGFSEINRFYRTGFEEQTTYSFPHGGISLGYNYEVENGEPGGPLHVRRNNQAGYSEVRYQFGRRMTATAGGRAEANSSFGTRAVPRTGLAYTARFGHDFWGATRLRTSYGLGIKEPTFIQSFEAGPCFPGNPNLRPERSTTFHAGVEQLLASDRLKVSVTYFHNDFHDIVSFSEDFNATPTCPFGTGTFFNTDKARAFGSNTSFESKVTSWLRIVGNYTYDDTKVLKAPNFFDPTLAPGNRLLHRPLHSANLIFNATVRHMNWNLAGSYVGRATDSDFIGLGITSNPSWVRWDLATILPLRHGLSATAKVENLFDRRYSDAVGFPALGLNYRIGLKYVWGRE